MFFFKDVVNFLNDRVDVVNCSFFLSFSVEIKFLSFKRYDVNDDRFITLIIEGQKEDSENSNFVVKTDRKKGVQCLMCIQFYLFYRCEAFKLKFVNERIEFIKTKRMCFNCINFVEYFVKSCKFLICCKVLECGKFYYILLYFFRFSYERNVVY